MIGFVTMDVRRYFPLELLGYTFLLFFKMCPKILFGAKWVAARAPDTKLAPNCMKYRPESIGNVPEAKK